MDGEATQRGLPLDIKRIASLVIYSPLILYVVLDFDLTPYGWTFEFLSFTAIATVAGCVVSTRYDLHRADNIYGEYKSRRTTRLLGGAMTFGGLFFVIGWISAWVDQGYSMTVIGRTILYQEMLPIDFVFGALSFMFGVPVLLRSYLGKSENDDLWRPGDD